MLFTFNNIDPTKLKKNYYYAVYNTKDYNNINYSDTAFIIKYVGNLHSSSCPRFMLITHNIYHYKHDTWSKSYTYRNDEIKDVILNIFDNVNTGCIITEIDYYKYTSSRIKLNKNLINCNDIIFAFERSIDLGYHILSINGHVVILGYNVRNITASKDDSKEWTGSTNNVELK